MILAVKWRIAMVSTRVGIIMMIYRHLRIHGRVQGVYFRGWAIETAGEMGLVGWVRNRRDGTVEALVAGDPVAVAAFVAMCRHGPPAARVDRIDETDVPAEPLSAFAGRPTE